VRVIENIKKIFTKNKMIDLKNKKAKTALSQIFVLITGIVAIGYALGSEVGSVRERGI